MSDWRDQAAADPRHGERTAALLGIALGVCFTTCFLTGLYSHLAQHPSTWFHLPARPAGLYRVTQGLHVLTGIATIPLLLAKLWSVFPKLLQWPPVSSMAHLLERVSLVPLVAGALFQLWTGLADIDLWYPLPSFFPTVHYWTAWITMGALVVHVGAKITTTRSALARTGSDERTASPPADPAARRRFLTAVGATSGLLVVTVAGQTIAPLRRLALLAPRRPDIGVQGFPVNKSAISAGVRHTATSPAYRLAGGGPGVDGPCRSPSMRSGRCRRVRPPCPSPVSRGGAPTGAGRGCRCATSWPGRARPRGASVTVHSLEPHGLYAQADVDAVQSADPDTLLALLVDGRPLALDHGYPIRLIGPDRPGVMQTKWVTRILVR